jgi:hypothetical protein
MRPRVKLGQILAIDEADYMYGRGHLVLKVTAIERVHQHHDDIWVALRGIQMRNAVEVGERRVLVRMAALAAGPQQPTVPARRA